MGLFRSFSASSRLLLSEMDVETRGERINKAFAGAWWSKIIKVWRENEKKNRIGNVLYPTIRVEGKTVRNENFVFNCTSWYLSHRFRVSLARYGREKLGRIPTVFSVVWNWKGCAIEMLMMGHFFLSFSKVQFEIQERELRLYTTRSFWLVDDSDVSQLLFRIKTFTIWSCYSVIWVLDVLSFIIRPLSQKYLVSWCILPILASISII